jgi:hypothetical protein
MIFVVRSNPDHFTLQYPESMKLNGVVSYMTVAQERAIEILFVVMAVCAFGNVSLGLYTAGVKRTEIPTSHDDETSRSDDGAGP